MASLLTEEIARRIVNAVSTGAKPADAAGSCGVGKSTINRWLHRGRQALERRDEHEGSIIEAEDQMYVALFADVEQARFVAKVEAIGIVRRAAIGMPVKETRTTTKTDKDGNVEQVVVVTERVDVRWQAAAWWLERQYQEEFALHQRLELSGPDGGPIDVATRAQRLADEAEAFLAAQASSPNGSSANGHEPE